MLPEKLCIVATVHLLKFTCSLVKGGDELMSGDEDIFYDDVTCGKFEYPQNKSLLSQSTFNI